MDHSIGERLDRKYKINAMSEEHGRHHDEHDSVLFLAKDKALPDTLRYYRDRCAALGSDERQISGITLLIERVERWQAMYTDRVKVADVEPGTLGYQILKPNALA